MILQNVKEYYDFLLAAEYKECNEALLRIVPKIDIEEINAFVDNVPYISKLQRKFYKTYIYARYERIIMSAYEQG